MKKIFIVLIILMIGVSGAFAQITLDTLQTEFLTFSNEVAVSLPYASTIGLNWSDATVRGFPHFGVGVTLGAVTLPSQAFSKLAKSLDITLPPEIESLGFGVPLPGYTVEGRLGGLFLPFDLGIKLGYIPQDAISNVLPDMPVAVDYTLAGFDIRVPLMKQNIILPSIAFSAGYNYLSGGINATIEGSGDLGTEIDLDSLISGASAQYSDPDLRFAWEAHTLDFKLQASKSLLIFTPYIGGGYTYGWSKAGGGISSDITYVGATEEEVRQALIEANYDVELSGDSFTIYSDLKASGSFRAYAGLSLNLFLLKLDLNAMYNVDTASFGGGANVRLAF